MLAVRHKLSEFSGCMKNAVCPLAVQASIKGIRKHYNEDFAAETHTGKRQ